MIYELSFDTLWSGVQVEIDDLIQDLLVLPPGTDLHKHPLVLNGSIVLQVTNYYLCAYVVLIE